MGLFRSEVIESQRMRLYGAVTLHQPVSFAIMTASICVVAALALAFLATGSYSQKETVTGWIVPTAGLTQLYTVKSGPVTQVSAKVGDQVAAGQVLALVSVDVSGVNGGLAPQQGVLMHAKMDALDLQIAATTKRSSLETIRLRERALGLRQEVVHLRAQLAAENEQRVIAERQLEHLETLLAKGFATEMDRDHQKQTAIGLDQTIAELQRQIAAKLADADDIQRQAEAQPTALAADLAQLRAQKVTYQQSLVELGAQDTLTIRSPIAGRVAAVNIRAGDLASPASPLIAVAPANSALMAELFAPSRASGFIAAGQTVRLKIDAFPSQRFGEVEGDVAVVSRAPVILAQVGVPLDIKEPVYRVSVVLKSGAISAYGARQPLQPGMTLSAAVVTAKRTLLQWMLDPLRAVGRGM